MKETSHAFKNGNGLGILWNVESERKRYVGLVCWRFEFMNV